MKGCWYRRPLSPARLCRHLAVSGAAPAYLTALGSGPGRAEWYPGSLPSGG
jgi:hypothetical protein